MANLIQNGNFETGVLDSYSNYIPDNWMKIKPEYYAGWFTTTQSDNGVLLKFSDADGTQGVHGVQRELDSFPPGLYQCLDLSDNFHDLGISVSFKASSDSIFFPGEYENYNSEIFDVYIYKVDSDFSLANKKFNDYVMRKTFTMDVHEDDWVQLEPPPPTWTEFSFNYSLKPGYYVIGFTPHTTFDGGSVITINNTYFHLNDVVGEYNVLPTVEYNNILTNSDFNKGIEDWTNVGLFCYTYEPAPGDFYCPENLRLYCVGLRFASNVILDNVDIYRYGLHREIFSENFCQAEIRMWHRSTMQNLDGESKIFLYETRDNTDGTYTIIEPAIVEETVMTHNYCWDFYSKVVDIVPGRYLLIIRPPLETQEEGAMLIDNVSFNIVKSDDNSHKGTYLAPYTLQDGSIVYSVGEAETSVCFRFFDGRQVSDERFIKIKSDYYCTNGASEFDTGYLFCYRNTMVQSPSDAVGARFFLEDGKMATSTKFVYQGNYYEADFDGNLTRLYANIIDLVPDITMASVLVGETFTITVGFDKQEFLYSLNVTSSDASKIAIVDITPGYDNNVITFIAKDQGDSIITITHESETGYIIKEIIPAYARHKTFYMGDIDIELQYGFNYINTNSSYAVKYNVTPESAASLPLEWTSSHRGIATIDMYGQILSGEFEGETTITVSSPNTGLEKSFTLYVSNSYKAPYSINLSETELELAIGDKAKITAGVYDEDGGMNTKQDKMWFSDDESIVKVDDFGNVVAINRGTTTLRCYSERYIAGETVAVKVTGTKVEVTEIKLDLDSAAFCSPRGENHFKLNYKLLPINANPTTVTWSSTDEGIITVSPEGDVYLSGSYKSKDYISSFSDSAAIVCTCDSNKNIKASCGVSVNLDTRYKCNLGAFDTVYKTHVSQSYQDNLRIDFNYFINYGEIPSASINYVPGVWSLNVEKDGTVVINPENFIYNISTYKINKYIEFIPKEAGEYKITIEVHPEDEPLYIDSIEFNVTVLEENQAPQYLDQLEVLYALQNGSFILRCRVEDDINTMENLVFSIDFGDGKGYEEIYAYPLVYNLNNYQYFFCEDFGLDHGKNYSVKVKVADDEQESESNVAILYLPSEGDMKVLLNEAKTDYDRAKNDIIGLLEDLIDDSVMSKEDEGEFDTRYRIYNFNYENMYDALVKCIQYIDNQIATSQAQMASLASGESAMVYSLRNSAASSNYQNVTDMDYYQNECIKQLMERVLQLEAFIQELMSNNNNN